MFSKSTSIYMELGWISVSLRLIHSMPLRHMGAGEQEMAPSPNPSISYLDKSHNYIDKLF